MDLNGFGYFASCGGVQHAEEFSLVGDKLLDFLLFDDLEMTFDFEANNLDLGFGEG